MNVTGVVNILRGSKSDPYILNKKPDDPFNGGQIILDAHCFTQTLDEYLTDFKPDPSIKVDFEKDRTGNEQEFADFTNDAQARIIYREKVKFRCIAVIERGMSLFKGHLDKRVGELYLPAIQQGKIPDDARYRNVADELRFEDEGRLEKFFTEAIEKATLHIEKKENEALCQSVESLIPEKINEFLASLSLKDRDILIYGIQESLKEAHCRIEELYKPAIKAGAIPDTDEYNRRIVELGYKDRNELRERLFYFLRYAICLVNWNDDDALRSNEHAFRSCID